MLLCHRIHALYHIYLYTSENAASVAKMIGSPIAYRSLSSVMEFIKVNIKQLCKEYTDPQIQAILHITDNIMTCCRRYQALNRQNSHQPCVYTNYHTTEYDLIRKYSVRIPLLRKYSARIPLNNHAIL